MDISQRTRAVEQVAEPFVDAAVAAVANQQQGQDQAGSLT
jgi:hypothetical protein